MASLLVEVKTLVFQILFKVMDMVFDCLFSLVYRGRSRAIPPIQNQLLLESAVSLAAKIRKGKLKSEDLVRAYISRIKEVQPYLNAVVDERFEDALEDAREVDKLVQSGTKSEEELARKKPLLGIPLTTKNSIGVKGLVQDAGLVSKKKAIADKDAEVISLMRESGAIIVCITNVPELLMWTECYNNVYGGTCNPYDTTRTPGGSSGGEGSLIASAGSLIGLGTDIGGSVRIPAFCTGIFGHKPTTGIIPGDGLFPSLEEALERYNTIGPMCRYACDLLPTLRVLAGKRSADLNLDSKVDVKKIKVYYMDDDGAKYFTRVRSDQTAAVNKVVDYFRECHGIRAQKVNLKTMFLGHDIWQATLAYAGSTKYPMATAFAGGRGKLNPWMELLLWFLRQSSHTLPAIYMACLEKRTYRKGERAYGKLTALGEALAKELEELLGDDGVLLYPGAAESPGYRQQHLTRFSNIKITCVFNILRVPSTSVPLGLNKQGLPTGIQVVANRFNDRLCLTVANELEKGFGGWHSPAPILSQ